MQHSLSLNESTALILQLFDDEIKLTHPKSQNTGPQKKLIRNRNREIAVLLESIVKGTECFALYFNSRFTTVFVDADSGVNLYLSS